MLYFDFKNYEEFKEIFGIIKHGNGVKSRKNKILLSLYKERKNLQDHIKANAAREYSQLACHFSLREDKRDGKGRRSTV